MAARLKVFVTSDGLTDYVVATSSRAKALAAWGAHQDLFATGGARETDDPSLVEAASARPGEVLRMAAANAPPPPPKARAAPKGPSPAALRKVAALEADLAETEARHATAVAALEAERAAVDARREAAEAAFIERRASLRAALRKARAAL